MGILGDFLSSPAMQIAFNNINKQKQELDTFKKLVATESVKAAIKRQQDLEERRAKLEDAKSLYAYEQSFKTQGLSESDKNKLEIEKAKEISKIKIAEAETMNQKGLLFAPKTVKEILSPEEERAIKVADIIAETNARTQAEIEGTKKKIAEGVMLAPTAPQGKESIEDAAKRAGAIEFAKTESALKAKKTMTDADKIKYETNAKVIKTEEKNLLDETTGITGGFFSPYKVKAITEALKKAKEENKEIEKKYGYDITEPTVTIPDDQSALYKPIEERNFDDIKRFIRRGRLTPTNKTEEKFNFLSRLS